MPHPVQLFRRREHEGMKSSFIGRVQERSNLYQPGNEVLERSRLVQKSRLARQDKLRNSSNRRREHELPSRHRLHQHKWKAFATAGKHHDVGPLIKGSHLSSGHMPQQRHAIFQPCLANQGLQATPFRPRAGDRTFEIHAPLVEFRASAQKERMIFHGMKPPHRQQRESRPASRMLDVFSRTDIHSEPRHDQLARLYTRIVIENVTPVVLRDGQAERAVR